MTGYIAIDAVRGRCRHKPTVSAQHDRGSLKNAEFALKNEPDSTANRPPNPGPIFAL